MWSSGRTLGTPSGHAFQLSGKQAQSPLSYFNTFGAKKKEISAKSFASLGFLLNSRKKNGKNKGKIQPHTRPWTAGQLHCMPLAPWWAGSQGWLSRAESRSSNLPICYSAKMSDLLLGDFPTRASPWQWPARRGICSCITLQLCIFIVPSKHLELISIASSCYHFAVWVSAYICLLSACIFFFLRIPCFWLSCVQNLTSLQR